MGEDEWCVVIVVVGAASVGVWASVVCVACPTAVGLAVVVVTIGVVGPVGWFESAALSVQSNVSVTVGIPKTTWPSSNKAPRLMTERAKNTKPREFRKSREKRTLVSSLLLLYRTLVFVLQILSVAAVSPSRYHRDMEMWFSLDKEWRWSIGCLFL